tara:strand:+ start:867 stop:1070 length:204 start_codon:yes stop_codon:yes gene_type:complete
MILMNDDKNLPVNDVWWLLIKLIITFFSAYIVYRCADNEHYSIPMHTFFVGILLFILMIKIWAPNKP